MPGHDAEPGRLRHEAAPGVEHVAPGRLRRLRAEPEERQRRFQQHRIGEGDRRLDEQRGEILGRISRKMMRACAHADGARGLDILLAQHHLGRGARQPREAGDEDDADGDHRVQDRGAEARHQHHGEQDRRERRTAAP